MTEKPLQQERLSKLEKAIQDLDASPSEILAIPEIREQIDTVRSQLEGLKSQVHRDDYETIKAPVKTSLDKLYKEAKIQKDKLESDRIKTIGLEVRKSISDDIATMPPVQSRLQKLLGLVEEVSKDPKKLEQKREEMNKLKSEIQELVVLVQGRQKKIQDFEKYIQDLRISSPRIFERQDVADLLTSIQSDIALLKEKIWESGEKYDTQSINMKKGILVGIIKKLEILGSRIISLNHAKDIVDTYFLSRPDLVKDKDLLGFFKAKNKEELVDILGVMIAESGNILTPEAIMSFYRSSIKNDPKTAPEKDLKSWIIDIKAQTPEVREANVTGKIPPDFEKAINKELRGPNTLTMLRVASARYNQEYNDYLNGVDNHLPLSELGFEGKNTGWAWFDAEAGKDLNLESQEGKLSFLKEYIRVLSLIVQKGEIPKEMDLGWLWITLWSVGGLAASVLAIWTYSKLKSKGEKDPHKKGWWERTSEMMSTNPNIYTEVEKKLCDEYRRYVEGNIMLIQARMSLGKNETITTSDGDTYGPISESEGKIRIDAIKTAVGSLLPSIESKGKVGRGMGKARDVGEDTEHGRRWAGDMGLTRYIQNIARAPGGYVSGWLLRPNVFRYTPEAWGGGRGKIPQLGLRLVPTLAAGIGSFYGHTILGPAALLTLPSIRRTMGGGMIRTVSTLWRGRMQGYRLPGAGGRRVPVIFGRSEISSDLKVLDDIAGMLLDDEDIKRRACSLEEQKKAEELLESYVDESQETVAAADRYTERQAFNDITRAIHARRMKLTRAELRIFTIQGVYLLKGINGLVSKDDVHGLVRRINTYRFSYSNTAPNNMLDTLYSRIVARKGKLEPQEMMLLTKDMETFYRGENISVTDMNKKSVAHDTVFDSGSIVRMDIAEAEEVFRQSVAWLNSRGIETVTREQFAQKILEILGGRNLPNQYSMYDKFVQEWENNVIHSGVGGKISKDISDGKIATQEELSRAVDSSGISDPAKKTELNDIMGRIFEEDIQRKTAILLEEIDKVFKDPASTQKEATDKIMTMLKKPEYRGAVCQFIPDAYTVDPLTNTPKLSEGIVKTRIETLWKEWIEAQITGIRTRFEEDPLLPIKDDTFIGEIEKIMSKCSPQQKKELATYFRDTLQGLVTNTGTLVEDRQRALDILKDPRLVGNYLGSKMASDDLVKFCTEQTKILSILRNRQMIQPLRESIINNPLDDDVLDSFEKLLVQEGIDKSIKKEIAECYRDALKQEIGDPNNSTEIKIKAIEILESSSIITYLERKDAIGLRTYISEQKEICIIGPLKEKILENALSIEPLAINDAIQKHCIDDASKKAVALLYVNSLEHIMISGEDIHSREAACLTLRGILQSESHIKRVLTGDPRRFSEVRTNVTKYGTIIDRQKQSGTSEMESLRGESATPPATPPPPSESAPAAPETVLSASDLAQLKEDMTHDPLSRGGKGIMSIQKRFDESCSVKQQKEIVGDYVDALKKIAQSTSTKIDIRERALTALKRDSIRKALPEGDPRTSLEAFITLEEVKIKRQKEAKSLLTGIEESLAGKTTPDEKVEVLLGDTSPLTAPQQRLVQSYRSEDGSMTEENFSAAIQHLLYKTQEVGVTGATIVDLHNALVASGSMTDINISLGRVGAAVIGENVNETVNVRGGGKR